MSVPYYLIVFNIVFNNQFFIFNVLLSYILHTFLCLNRAESVRYSGWCWQRAQYDLLLKLSIVSFYFKDFPKLSSKFLCGVLSLSSSCLIMETSALRFQNIFVGEPKYACKMIFVATLNWKAVRSFYLALFCHVLRGNGHIYCTFLCVVLAMKMEFLFDIL